MANSMTRQMGQVSAAFAGANARLGQSYLGRGIQLGVTESLGFYYSGAVFGTSGVVPEGWLGLKGTMNEFKANLKPSQKIAFQPGKVFSKLRSRGASPTEAYSGVARYTYRQAKPFVNFAASTAMKSLGLISTVAMVYSGGFFSSGWNKGGLSGAIGGAIESVALQSAFRIAGGALINPFTGVLAIGAAAGYGVYKAGEAAKRHVQSLGRLEMGGVANKDALSGAGAATSRQRAVSALQNTHLNGRMALGNEALLMHTSFR